jgi:hypothetical protein
MSYAPEAATGIKKKIEDVSYLNVKKYFRLKVNE